MVWQQAADQKRLMMVITLITEKNSVSTFSRRENLTLKCLALVQS